MLKVHSFPPESMRLGASFEGLPFQDTFDVWTSSWSIDPNQWPIRDYFGPMLLAGTEILTPAINLATATAHTRAKSKGNYVQYEGLQPVQSDRGDSDRCFSTEAFITNLYQFFSGGWQFVSADSERIPGEKPVSHTNISGEVQDGGSSGLYYRDQEQTYYVNPSDVTPQGLAYLRKYDSGVNLYIEPYTDHGQFHLATSPEQAFVRQANGLISELESSSDGYLYPWWNPSAFGNVDQVTVRAKNFSVQYKDGTSPVSFTWIHEDCWPYSTNQWYRTFLMRVELEWVPLLHPVILNDSFAAQSLGHLYLKYEAQRLTQYTMVNKQLPWTYYAGADVPVSYLGQGKLYFAHGLSDQSEEEPIGAENLLRYDVETTSHESNPYNLLLEFDSSIHGRNHDLFAAVTRSSKAAVEQCLNILEANHLETMTSLGEIRQFITPIKGMSRLASSIVKKDPYLALKGTLDLLSDLQLLYSFGLAPSVNDAEEISSRINPIKDQILKASSDGYATYSGKFVYDVPDDFISPYSGLKLIARSQVRARVSPNSFLAALLPLEAFGLFPTLSRMWDLVPFGFVADWFLNIGDRLDNFDTVIKCLMMDVKYSVHSVKIHWDVPDEILTDHQLVKVSDEVQLSYYVRSVSQRIPTMSYSELDFEAAGGIPNWGTAAALMYKLLG